MKTIWTLIERLLISILLSPLLAAVFVILGGGVRERPTPTQGIASILILFVYLCWIDFR